MSDYISSNGRFDGGNDIAYERYFGQLNHNIRDIGNSAHENVSRQHEEGKSLQPEGYMCAQSVLQSNGHSECVDDCFERELERLSSSMIALIRNARQKSLQANATCGNFQRPLLVKGSESQVGSDSSPEIHADRQLMQRMRSSVETNFDECTDMRSEHGNNLPTGISQTASTCSSVSAPSNLAFLQNAGKDGTNPIPWVSRGRKSAQTTVTPMGGIGAEKDRQQKHSYNKKYVKSRRPIVTERITELGNLFPENNSRTAGRRNGSVLKESIEYIKRLKQEKDLIQELEDKMREIDAEIKTLALALERLELCTTRKCTSSDERYQTQTESVCKEQCITNLTKTPLSCQRTDSFHSDPVLTGSPSKVFRPLSKALALDDVLDDFPSTLTSLPCSSGKSIDNMDCYI